MRELLEFDKLFCFGSEFLWFKKWHNLFHYNYKWLLSLNKQQIYFRENTILKNVFTILLLCVILCHRIKCFWRLLRFCKNVKMSVSFAVFNYFWKIGRLCSQYFCIHRTQPNEMDHKHMICDIKRGVAV